MPKRSFCRKRVVKRRAKKRSYKKRRGAGAKMISTRQKSVRVKCSLLYPTFNAQSALVAPVQSVVSTCAFLNSPTGSVFVSEQTNVFTPSNIPPAFAQFMQFAAIYDEFTCTGVRIKSMLSNSPAGNRLSLTDMAQDNNTLILVGNVTSPSAIPLPRYSNYSTVPGQDRNTFTRYFPMAALKKSLGISWCSTLDVPTTLFPTAGFTYYGQLAGKTCPSFCWRHVFDAPVPVGDGVGMVEITYYYTFRGIKPLPS